MAAACALLAACASDNNDGGLFTTGAIGAQQVAEAPKVDPACVSLATRIDGLRREGVSDKIEKAAVKKYKMTQADLGKADQLTKANAEFQLRCSTVTSGSTQAYTTPRTKAPGPATAATSAN